MEIKRFKVNEYQKKQIISFGTGKIEDEIVLFGAGNVGIIVAQSFIQNKISSVFFSRHSSIENVITSDNTLL